jgi:hypothetical protein
MLGRAKPDAETEGEFCMAWRLCWADNCSFFGVPEKNWARRLPLEVEGLLSPIFSVCGIVLEVNGMEILRGMSLYRIGDFSV